ncbi:MAG: hypothetical protein ACKO2L_15195 [Planctomycetaceae bacterium]
MTVQRQLPPASPESMATENSQEERLRSLERAITTAERRLQRLDASIESLKSLQQALAPQARRTAMLLSELATFLKRVPADCLDSMLQGAEQPAVAERAECSPMTSAKPSGASRKDPKKSRSKPKKSKSNRVGSTQRPRKAGKR